MNLTTEQFKDFLDGKISFFCGSTNDAHDFLKAVSDMDTDGKFEDIAEFKEDLSDERFGIDESGIYYFINKDWIDSENEFVFDSCLTKDCMSLIDMEIVKWNVENEVKKKCPMKSMNPPYDNYCDPECAWRVDVTTTADTKKPICAVATIGIVSIATAMAEYNMKFNDLEI